MRDDFSDFLSLPEQGRRDVFEAAARRLDTVASYVEKDFWVCVVLDALFNRRPEDHPGLLFKGGTSLSKGFGLISRFSEDIDLVVSRSDLGFVERRDPINPRRMSIRERRELFAALRDACSAYIRGDMVEWLGRVLGEHCRIVADEDDPDAQTLLIEYPTRFPVQETNYVQPRVKLEAGARSAVEPSVTGSVAAFIAEELAERLWDVDGIAMIVPERTFLEKLLILHGAYCGYRDEGRLPVDRHRISRHYYDVAMMFATPVGRTAVGDSGLLEDVRNHNLLAFRQAWKRFEQAVPGMIGVIPQAGLYRAVQQDYGAMRNMILGEAPDFEWIVGQLEGVDALVNPRTVGSK